MGFSGFRNPDEVLSYYDRATGQPMATAWHLYACTQWASGHDIHYGDKEAEPLLVRPA